MPRPPAVNHSAVDTPGQHARVCAHPQACAIVHNLILDVHGPRGASNAGVQVDTRGRALNLNELMTEFVFEANGQPPTPVPASYTHASHTKHGTCQVLDTAEHARLAAALMNHCQAYNYTDRG